MKLINFVVSQLTLKAGGRNLLCQQEAGLDIVIKVSKDELVVQIVNRRPPPGYDRCRVGWSLYGLVEFSERFS